MDNMAGQLEAALNELQTVKQQPSEMQENPVKRFVSRAVNAVENKLHTMQERLSDMKEYIVEGAKQAPEGFKLETARILFSIIADTKTNVEVPNEKEGAPTPAPTTPENPGTPDDMPQVTIPKTGETFPTLRYALAVLLLAATALCGAALYRKRKPQNQEPFKYHWRGGFMLPRQSILGGQYMITCFTLAGFTRFPLSLFDTANPDQTEVQRYQSIQSLLENIGNETEGQRETAAHLRALCNDLNEHCWNSYGLDIEDERTVCALCERTLEPAAEPACVLLSDWNRLNVR